MLEKFLKRKPKPSIGLDITPEGITAVLLGENNNKFSLKNYAFEPFKGQVFQNGNIVNPEAFNKALNNLVENNKFDAKTVCIAVPSNVAFVKLIQLPALPPDELQIIATQEASKHIPFSVEEANIDFEVLDNIKLVGGSKKTDVVLAALSKDVAKGFCNLISNCGLEVVAIDVAPFAMIRTLENAGLINNPAEQYISVMIGHEVTDINIIHKGMPVFSHSTPIGKHNIIESIVSSLGIDDSEIGKLLSDVALIIPGMNLNPDASLNKAATAIRTVFNNISSEIEKAIEFYTSQNTQPVEIKKIIIGGHGTCIQNIDKYIENRLRVETVLCNSLNNVNYNPQTSKNLSHVNIATLATSVGLALKGLKN